MTFMHKIAIVFVCLFHEGRKLMSLLLSSVLLDADSLMFSQGFKNILLAARR